MEKISAVYKIINTVTGDFYVGSSSNVMKRWADHKCPSTWKNKPNKPLYQDMQKYGLDKFRFQILCPVEPEHLKQVEQELIDMLHPTYNQINAKSWNVERYKESIRKYQQSEKGKEYMKDYKQTEKYKEYEKKYNQTEKRKEYMKKYQKKYNSRLCNYNGETLKLSALIQRFRRAGIEHPDIEAKKYLINEGLIQC